MCVRSLRVRIGSVIVRRGGMARVGRHVYDWRRRGSRSGLRFRRDGNVWRWLRTRRCAERILSFME
eukprot:5285139-Pleurochrysis_carterae.AAC.2